MCLALGGKHVEDVPGYKSITHYIACDDDESFKRTFSTIAAFGTAQHIVKSSWLIKSFQTKKFFRFTTILYLTVSHTQNMGFPSVLLSLTPNPIVRVAFYRVNTSIAAQELLEKEQLHPNKWRSLWFSSAVLGLLRKQNC